MTAIVCCKHYLSMVGLPVCLECYKELSKELDTTRTALVEKKEEYEVVWKEWQTVKAQRNQLAEELAEAKEELEEAKATVPTLPGGIATKGKLKYCAAHRTIICGCQTEKLEQELAEARKVVAEGHLHNDACQYCKIIFEDKEKLKSRLTQLQEALGKYGHHLYVCEIRGTLPDDDKTQPCTCGFDSALGR